MAQNLISDYATIKPQNLTIVFDSGSTFGAALSGNNACPLQNVNISIDVPREDMKSIGWAYPEHRPINWPISINVRADAYLNQFQLDTLNRNNCSDNGYNLSINFDNKCELFNSVIYTFRGMKLDNQQFTSSIGSLSKVSFDWSLKVYDFTRTGGPNFFFKTAATDDRTAYESGIFPQVAYSPGLYPFVIEFGDFCYIDIMNGPATLDGNEISVSDDPSTVTIRITPSGTSQFQDIVTTVTPG
jgi:hypothetical protein